MKDLVEVIDVDEFNGFVAMGLKHNPKLANIVFIYEAGLKCIYDTSDGHKRVIYSDIFGEGDLANILSDLENQYKYSEMSSRITDFDIDQLRVIKKYIRKSEVNALKRSVL